VSTLFQETTRSDQHLRTTISVSSKKKQKVGNITTMNKGHCRICQRSRALKMCLKKNSKSAFVTKKFQQSQHQSNDKAGQYCLL